MGNGYARDEMFKLNVKHKALNVSVYMLSSLNFRHAHLCHINSRYVAIMSSLGLIPKLIKDFQKCKFVVKQKVQNNLIKVCKKYQIVRFNSHRSL